MNGILWGSLSMKCETWTNYILYGPQEVKLKGKLCMGHGKEQEAARFGGGFGIVLLDALWAVGNRDCVLTIHSLCFGMVLSRNCLWDAAPERGIFMVLSCGMGTSVTQHQQYPQAAGQTLRR